MNKPQTLARMRISGSPLDMGSGPPPVEPYISAEQFEAEREQLFKRVWLEVARDEELPEIGDYLVLELEILQTSVILVRGRDRQVRAFHNICTHRGNTVTLETSGNTGGFICGYHGWTYDLDGSLKALPGEEYFSGARKCDLGLPSLACDVWNGFIYINYDPAPEQTLREYLGSLADDMEGYPFARFQHIAQYNATVKVNWKAFTDAFREGYHVGTVHGGSLPDAMNSPDNPFGVPLSARIHGVHFSLTNGANPNHKPTPSEALAWQFGMSFSPGELLDLQGINPDGHALWWFDMNMNFPNFWMALGPGWYFTYNFWPIAVDETRWTRNIYQLAARDFGERIAQEHTKCLLRDLLYEDLSTLENTQKALASGVLKGLTISDHMEISVRQQHWAVARYLSGAGS